MSTSGRRVCRSIGAALVVLVAAAPVYPQTTGAVLGSVADETGTRLPGVTVTLEGVGAPRTRITDAQGDYRFLNLDPGTYELGARLDGYSQVELPEIVVELSRNTTIRVTLTRALEEAIVVSAESPLLDERRMTPGAVASLQDLETIPTARDPWAVVSQAPGVLVDRINVGGSESGQQSLFVAPGSSLADNDWMMDGIQITDTTSVGAPSTYFDFGQFEAIELATGGPSVLKNTPGASINLVTRRGTNEFRGTARFLSARDDGLGFLGQSGSGLDCSDLPETQDCDSFVPAQINDISEYGFEAGGPAVPDRLWLWGSYGVSDIDRAASGGGQFVTNLENVAVKLNAQLGVDNSAVASWNNGNKTVAGRGAGPDRAPETTLDQRGPTAFWRFEDTHLFSSNFYLTGSYQKSDLGFQLKPRSDCLDSSCSLEQEALWDSDGVFRHNFLNRLTRRPEDALRLDGSFFFGGDSLSHELAFGGRYRSAEGFTNVNIPGRDILHIAGENLGNPPGPVDFFLLLRHPKNAPVEVDYKSLWVQDTLAMGRWTVNLGLRWDLQDGVNKPGSTGTSPVPEIFPEITLEKAVDAGFEWESITPRLGVTYAVGEERNTLLRASFAQFPEALGTNTIAWTNPLGSTANAYFLFFDDDGDNKFRGDEFNVFLFGDGYDVKNPTTNWNTVDPGYDPELTTEIVLAVEHSPLPELVVGLSYTRREIDDISEVRDYVRPIEESGRGFTVTASDYVLDLMTSATLPDGTESTVPVYSLDPALEFTGYGHLQNGSRSRQYDGISLTLNKRLANRWSLRGFLNWGEAEWRVPPDYLDNSDPTDTEDSSDNDGGLYMVDASGRVPVWMHSAWQWNLTGIYQVAPDSPWGFNLAANLYGREGYALPYSNVVNGSDGLTRVPSHVSGDIDRFKNDDVTTVDLRAEKTLGLLGGVDLTVGVELFNALNAGTVLSRRTTLNRPTADWVLDNIAPRIWKLSVRVNWK
jgi:hypothetical protein